MSELNVGLDIGYGQVKAYMENKNSEIIKISFPRIFAEAQGEAWKELCSADVCGIEGNRFVIGDQALNYGDGICSNDARDYVLHHSYYLER